MPRPPSPSRNSFLEALRENPFVGILRGIGSEHIVPVADASISAGLGFLEVTMNTPGAPELIRSLVDYCGTSLSIGAGTVTSRASLDAALDSGARFIVAPTFSEDVAAGCAEADIPYLPGALTPSEVERAWIGGATIVKLFPARAFGPSYLREMRGPFDRIPLLACGGVDAKNAAEYFAAGAEAVAFGASIYRADWIAHGEWRRIGEAIHGLRRTWPGTHLPRNAE